MPGQKMNVLEVPFDNEASAVHSHASPLSLAAAAKTLNPFDRYTNPQPPPKPIIPDILTSGQGTLKTAQVLRSKVRTPFFLPTFSMYS